jgi:hypothetical protein
VQSLTNNCAPLGYVYFNIQNFSAANYKDAYTQCAAVCAADSTCVDMLVFYVNCTAPAPLFGCATGAPGNDWAVNGFQCGLPYPPYQPCNTWYDRGTCNAAGKTCVLNTDCCSGVCLATNVCQ